MKKKEEKWGVIPGRRVAGGAGHGRSAKPTAAWSAWMRRRSAVSEGEPARQRPRKVPSKPQGAAGEPVRRRQVSFAKSTAKRAS
jgi:hypothetical protein